MEYERGLDCIQHPLAAVAYELCQNQSCQTSLFICKKLCQSLSELVKLATTQSHHENVKKESPHCSNCSNCSNSPFAFSISIFSIFSMTTAATAYILRRESPLPSDPLSVERWNSVVTTVCVDTLPWPKEGGLLSTTTTTPAGRQWAEDVLRPFLQANEELVSLKYQGVRYHLVYVYFSQTPPSPRSSSHADFGDVNTNALGCFDLDEWQFTCYLDAPTPLQSMYTTPQYSTPYAFRTADDAGYLTAPDVEQLWSSMCDAKNRVLTGSSEMYADTRQSLARLFHRLIIFEYHELRLRDTLSRTHVMQRLDAAEQQGKAWGDIHRLTNATVSERLDALTDSVLTGNKVSNLLGDHLSGVSAYIGEHVTDVNTQLAAHAASVELVQENTSDAAGTLKSLQHRVHLLERTLELQAEATTETLEAHSAWVENSKGTLDALTASADELVQTVGVLKHRLYWQEKAFEACVAYMLYSAFCM
jgi:hypothetical protein